MMTCGKTRVALQAVALCLLIVGSKKLLCSSLGQNALPSSQSHSIIDVNNTLQENHKVRQLRISSHLFRPTVTVVDKSPATKLLGSLSMPNGSAWCQGLPTIWFEGHQALNERPWCQQHDGTWNQSQTAVLDIIDESNAANGRQVIDRHGCAAFDVNQDGIADIFCTTGAQKGLGLGASELYLSHPNGSLAKVLDKTIGLDPYPTMRNRLAVPLRGPNNSMLLFVGVKGDIPRADGQYNKHIMLQSVYQSAFPDLRPWFSEVQTSNAPWKVASDALAAIPADITGNGVDDLILCQKRQAPMMFLQSKTGEWRLAALPKIPATSKWSNVRIADVTGDGRKDLIAVDQGRHGSRLWVFEGQPVYPYFDFHNPWYESELPFSSPDLEILDVDANGRPDIYVIQTNTKTGYCSKTNPRSWWGGKVQPGVNWTPPPDSGRDRLFVGQSPGRTIPEKRFSRVTMNFRRRGCGGMALRFGSDQRLILGNGDMGHPGNHMFLEWGLI